jgi:hypothetical protein
MWIVWVRILRCIQTRMFVSYSCWCQYKFLLSVKWFHEACFLVRILWQSLCVYLSLSVYKIRSIFVISWLVQDKVYVTEEWVRFRCVYLSLLSVSVYCLCFSTWLFSTENALYLVKSTNWDKNCRALIRVYHPHLHRVAATSDLVLVILHVSPRMILRGQV